MGLRSVPVDTFEICRSVLTMSVMSLYQTKGPIGWKRASIASLPRWRNVALRTADGILRLSPIVVLDPFEDRSAAPLIGVAQDRAVDFRFVAPFRHANCSEQRLSLGVKRKAFARFECFAFWGVIK